jgi:hypothetical protein
MTDRTDTAIAVERAAALALAVATKQLAAHNRLRAACRQFAVQALMATEMPATGKPYTFTAADKAVGLVREYHDWHEHATDLEVTAMLAEVELHVAKQTTELAVRLAGPAPIKLDVDVSDASREVLRHMAQPWHLGEDDR